MHSSCRGPLGAHHGRVLRLVLGEGAVLVGVGVLIGVPGVYAAGGVIRGVLVGVSPADPLTLLAVALAAMAAWRDERIVSATLFAAQVDFTHAGDLKVFVDEEQVEAIERKMAERGKS